MTFDNTTYDQLAEMTADVLAQVVAAEPEVRSNDDKSVDEESEWFSRWWWLLWERWDEDEFRDGEDDSHDDDDDDCEFHE